MTKSIPLTQGKFALVDDEDFEKINEYKWSYQARGYAYKRNPNQSESFVLWMHRVIMNAPDYFEVDHVNGNGLDNRKENLRLSTRSQNAINTPKRKNNTSGYKGVTFFKRDKKWKAQITFEGRNIALGCYNTPIEAALVYDDAARKYFGEFASVNFRKGE